MPLFYVSTFARFEDHPVKSRHAEKLALGSLPMFEKPQQRPLILKEAVALSPSVRKLVFDVADGEPFRYAAGQYVDLYVPGAVDEEGAPLKRSYSIASAPNHAQPERFEIAVTHVEGGPASARLHELSVGEAIEMHGPSGLFTRLKDPLDTPSIYVGTGTGLSPLRAMIHDELRARPSGPQMVLIFGARTEADILWQEEFNALASRHERFRYEVTLSRAERTWHGRRGYVQEHIRELIDATSHVYICGLSKMVTEVRDLLKHGLGFDRKQVHSERYD